MGTIKLKNGIYTIIDNDIDDIILNKNWVLSSHGYVCRFEKGKCFLLHREIMNAKFGEIIDHINGNILDNRKVNLRFCTHAENMFNKKIYKNNKCGYKGVHYDKGSFRVIIYFNRKRINVGNYATALEAAEAYNKHALLYHGEFAKLNIINYGI